MHWAGRFRFTLLVMVLISQISLGYSKGLSPLSSNQSLGVAQADQAQIWVTAPQWMSDLKSLLNLPVDESILKQVLKSEIRKREKEGLYAETLELLKVGLVIYPRDAFFPYRTGMILAVFDSDQAQQYLALAKDQDPAYAEKADSVIQFIESNPGSGALDLVHMGQVMGQVEEWNLAETLFTRAVETNPQLADAWALLGQARVLEGRDGFNQFSKALSVDPNSPIGLALMSMYWQTHQRLDLALDYMKLLNTTQPNQVTWLFELGRLYSLNQDMEAAYSAYLQSTILAPKDPLTWQNLAFFCLNYSVHLEDAGLPAVRTLMTLEPDSPLSLTLMGQGLLNQGDLDTAERFLLQAIQKDPEFSTGHYVLGFLYLAQNNKSAAFPELVKVIELDGENGYGPSARRLLQDNFAPG